MQASDDQLRRNPTRPGARKVTALLEKHYVGSTATESELEEAFLALCRRAGLPPPQVQQWLILPDGGAPIRADFYWPEQRVVVETDGDKYHGPDKWADDMQRERNLMRAGWGAFWRCFASAFVRRRKEMLDDLLTTLAERGIDVEFAPFLDRPDGWPGLIATYGLRFDQAPRQVSADLRYRALESEKADLVIGYAQGNAAAPAGYIWQEQPFRATPPASPVSWLSPRAN